MLDNTGFDNEQVVFEQFLDYEKYLSGSNQVRKFKNMVYFENKDSVIVHASELKKYSDKIIELIKKKNDKKIQIKFLSFQQAKDYSKLLKKLGFEKVVRSKNEVLYSVAKLNSLEGPEFAKLRNKKRRIEKIPFSYKELSSVTCEDAIYVNRRWWDINSDIYKIDRRLNEESLITQIDENSKTNGLVQYYNNQPTGLCIYNISRPTLIQFITKGINNQTGNSFASTALYLKMFSIADQLGFEFINDGSLGIEPGTIKHKQSFHPCKYTQTFDYYLKRLV